MRRPLKQKSGSRGTVSRVSQWAAPVGGWTVKENAANMSPEAAYQLDNWFPDTNAVTVRPGYGFFARVKPFETPVGTLMAYQSGTATEIFACCGSEIIAIGQEDLAFANGAMTAVGTSTCSFLTTPLDLTLGGIEGAYGEFALGETA